MGALVKQGLLLTLCLGLVGILVAFFIGGIWLVVWAPQLLLLGAVLLVVCWSLAALVGTIARRR
jgi:hypothetical protein